MRTKRFRLTRKSNPRKVVGVLTVRGRSKKELARNASQLSKALHLPFLKDKKKKR